MRHRRRGAVLPPSWPTGSTHVAARLGPARRLVLVEAANDLAGAGRLPRRAARRPRRAARAPRRPGPGRRARRAVRPRRRDRRGRARSASRRPGQPARAAPRARRCCWRPPGSTGSPRLVRLLDGAPWTPTPPRSPPTSASPPTTAPALTLPMHYCYGLSVVHSNLLAGAALLLDRRARCTDPAFWARSASTGSRACTASRTPSRCSSASASPRWPCRTCATSPRPAAGWRPTRCAAGRRSGERSGWRLFVMYGQTEATARMAYLPPELAATAPGGDRRRDPGRERSPSSPRRRPPASGRSGLPRARTSCSATPAPRPTSPSGGPSTSCAPATSGRRRPDGLFEVVGRRSRVRQAVRGAGRPRRGSRASWPRRGIEAACTGNDARLVVAPSTGPAATARPRRVGRPRRRCGLPAPLVTVVVVVDELPRRPNGKLDHPAVAALAAPRPAGAAASGRCRRDARGGDRPRARGLRPDVPRAAARRRRVVRRPRRGLPDLRAGLGRHRAGARRTSRRVGPIPARRARGDDPAPATAPSGGPRSRRWSCSARSRSCSSSASTPTSGRWLGGAHLLLAMSGWTFARFVLARDRRPRGPVSGGVPAQHCPAASCAAPPGSPCRAPPGSPSARCSGNVRFVDVLLLGSLAPPLVRGLLVHRRPGPDPDAAGAGVRATGAAARRAPPSLRVRRRGAAPRS